MLSELANNIYSPCEAAEEFTTLITTHLRHHSVIRPGNNSTQQISSAQHHERAIVRLTKCLASIKNNMRKNFPHSAVSFWMQCMLAICKSYEGVGIFRGLPESKRKPLDLTHGNSLSQSVNNHPRLHLHSPKLHACPTYFESSCDSSSQSYSGLPDWVSEVMLCPNITRTRGVSIHWTGLLEWNTGLDYWNDLCPFCEAFEWL